MVARGWSEAQKRAYVIADNKLALNAGWDDDLLGVELGELKDLGFDLDLIGFSELELSALASPPRQGLTDPDETPAVPAEPVSRTGTSGSSAAIASSAATAPSRRRSDRFVDLPIGILRAGCSGRRPHLPSMFVI